MFSDYILNKKGTKKIGVMIQPAKFCILKTYFWIWTQAQLQKVLAIAAFYFYAKSLYGTLAENEQIEVSCKFWSVYISNLMYHSENMMVRKLSLILNISSINKLRILKTIELYGFNTILKLHS